MKVEAFKHEGVKPDGTFENKAGAVYTKGRIIMSRENGGCDLHGCTCSEGHWITIVEPRTEDGIVEGVKVMFDNKSEMDTFLKKRELIN